MKRSAMPARSKPLKQKSPLKRTAALSASPLARSAVHAREIRRANQPKRATASRPAIPARIRAALHARSEGLCEIATEGCMGWAAEDSHRLKLGIGGRKGNARKAHDVLSNLLHACHNCHQTRGHRSPAEAYDAGWMLREYQNPLKEPVLRRGRWVLLGDDGSIEPTTKED